MNRKNTPTTLNSKFQQLLVSFLAVNMLFFSGMAQSSTLYAQGPLGDGDGPASFYEEHSADNFMLTGDASVTGIQWWGSFYDDSLSNNSFDVRFFSDNSGSPSNTAFESFSVSASRTTTLLDDFYGAPVFLFEASLSAFDLLASTEYYVSIVHPEDAFDDEFYWLQSDETGSNYTRNMNPAENNDWVSSSSVPGNLAFSLQGNQSATVPEPNVFALIALAFIGFSFYSRSIKV